MSSKEGRGGLFGMGRKGNAESASDDGGESGATATATADKGSKPERRGKSQAEIVAAPAVTDGEGSGPAKPVAAASAPVNASAHGPANGSATSPANGSSAKPTAPAKSTTPAKPVATVMDAPPPAPEKPVKKIALAPSRAGSSRADKPEPLKSDAPIPRSRLGRTKGSDAIRAPRVRRARLKIANIDPWSVMKVSFLFSVALGVILLVAVALLWGLLDLLGFFSSVGNTIDDVSGNQNSSGFDVQAFFSLPRVLGMTTIVALIDIVMITAFTTLCAYLYNISTDLVGGVEVTLAEEE